MRVATLLTALVLGPLTLSACGDTVQSKPVPHNVLEGLIAATFPVYWVGGRFSGLELNEAVHDASGAYSTGYGPCVEGGQGTCSPALRIVTSPDNSFLPGGSTPLHATTLRGQRVLVAAEGRTLVIATADVVIDIYARSRATARAAALTMVPINRILSPGDALPAPRPDSGFALEPLPSQIPRPLTLSS